ncbi:TPA: hypothetical protein N5L24_000279 [Enterobacter roggenkampii]|uniref:hypothetical protein n=1 Tax=Enterobacter roggenkampii TaxID=1812935 RepID=UPI001F4690B6|nr:hypothetical protein [Enterobacter roggenkampii]MCK7178546.1 hypothetical protein [Enterobacter roggenkampii]HCM9210165.1 hypothetical protein [Enterobacter roggenkampii]HDR2386600.1 hypothetical protein [Enterobacter roggenkampii]HDS4387361.1 hypothetical protein [Enterobacter roggenkampii]HDT2104791.1 hypothetical protein [Enterobacter roggenkampii]
MKRITKKERDRDILRAYLHRTGRDILVSGHGSINPTSKASKINRWIDAQIKDGLNCEIRRGRDLFLTLPKVMNFSSNYHRTMQAIQTIRHLTGRKMFNNQCYRLCFVDFSKITYISASAALVLTAELSKWDDSIRQRLRPKVKAWNKNILSQFDELGFFDLFRNKDSFELDKEKTPSHIRFVKYMKGHLHDDEKTQHLRGEIKRIIGENLEKWTFLYSGLSEAITNVVHHAYPDNKGYSEADKKWYLTASYDSVNKIIKVVFYDQGITIPGSLPDSKLHEKILTYLAKLPLAERKRDEQILKAAVEIKRSSTGEEDRGKGLQDLLEFIKQRGEGYLSIMSGKGLYKYSQQNTKTEVKSVNFTLPVCGTLIVWSTKL